MAEINPKLVLPIFCATSDAEVEDPTCVNSPPLFRAKDSQNRRTNEKGLPQIFNKSVFACSAVVTMNTGAAT